MRVYGASPLYNYVELIFRSKRLFIVSILLATIATVAFVVMRTKTYNATALVLLSGSAQAIPNVDQTDRAQRGSIQYKLNILNLVLKDPNFMKAAFKEAGLNKDMNDEQFDEFCKKARTAMTYAAGENILEISCKWNDRTAEDIINAFYSAYARRVIDQETVLSQNETKLLSLLLDDYVKRERELESRITAYKKTHVESPLNDPDSASLAYRQMKQAVYVMGNQLDLAKIQLNRTKEELARTPKTIEEVKIIQGTQANPLFQALQLKKVEQESKIQELLQTKTEQHPLVLRERKLLDTINSQILQLEQAEKANKNKPKEQEPFRRQESINPAYQNLDNRRTDWEIRINAMEKELANARQELVKRYAEARKMPQEIYNYKWMTRDMAMYTTIRENLSAKLEAAKMEEKRDRELSMSQITMMVDPKAEPEVVGAKSFIFLAAGPILGIIIAFSLSLLAESLDHSLRTPIEVEKHLGKPVLAVLPRMELPKDRSQRRLGGGGGEARPTLPSS